MFLFSHAQTVFGSNHKRKKRNKEEEKLLLIKIGNLSPLLKPCAVRFFFRLLFSKLFYWGVSSNYCFHFLHFELGLNVWIIFISVLVIFECLCHFSFGYISVLVTFQFLRHFSFGEILVSVTFQFWRHFSSADILLLVTF